MTNSINISFLDSQYGLDHAIDYGINTWNYDFERSAKLWSPSKTLMKASISSTNSFGFSMAAKCPP
jgi:hypothetical protein